MRNDFWNVPRYPDDSDYTTNSPSYYDDLARKQKLIKLLAKKIWEYEETLNLTLEDIESRVQERFTEWDERIESFPENVEDLLQQWLLDGTLDHIINETFFNSKADTVYVDNLTTFINVKNPPNNLIGATGDGVTDDGVNLKAIHEYANEKGLNVYYPKSDYVIGDVDTIPVNTPIDFGGSTLIIDQDNVTGNVLFNINTEKQWVDIPLSIANSFVPYMKKNTNYIDYLADTIPELQMIRVSYLTDGVLNNRGTERDSLTESFLHTQNSKIIGNVLKDVYSITAMKYRSLDTGLTIKNVNLTFKGTLTQSGFNIFNSERDKVHFDNFVIERDYNDLSVRKNIFFIKDTFENTLTNISGYNPKRNQIDSTVYLEGYIFSTSGTVNTSLKNITASTKHIFESGINGIRTWGAMGSNSDKNMVITHSHLSRIDYHSPANTLTVKHSEVDWVQIVGTGQLLFDNVVFTSSRLSNMIEFFSSTHTGYAGQWDGDIKFINCTYKPMKLSNNGTHVLIDVYGSDNYKYANYKPFNSLLIKDLTIDFTQLKNADNEFIDVIKLPVSNESQNFKSYIPDITIEGVHYLDNKNRINQGLKLVKSGNVYLEKDTQVIFDSINFRETYPSYNEIGLLIGANIINNYLLNISFNHCKYVSLASNVKGLNIVTDFYRSDVNMIRPLISGIEYEGKANFNQCKVNLKTPIDQIDPLGYAEDFTNIFTFNACEIYPYQHDGTTQSINGLLRNGTIGKLARGTMVNCFINESLIQESDKNIILENSFNINYFPNGFTIKNDIGELYSVKLSDTGVLTTTLL